MDKWKLKTSNYFEIHVALLNTFLPLIMKYLNNNKLPWDLYKHPIGPRNCNLEGNAYFLQASCKILVWF